MRLTPKLSHSLAYATLGAAGLLLPPLSGPAMALVVIAEPLFINVDESVVWANPSPYPAATLTASSEFEFGTTSNDVLQPTGSFGAKTYSISFPPDPIFPPEPISVLLPAVQINWGDSLAWTFAGTLATAAGGSLPTSACPASDELPPDPCNSATVALDLTGGFTAFDISGPIYAFDSPTRVGT
jgi:hypothetical protein